MWGSLSSAAPPGVRLKGTVCRAHRIRAARVLPTWVGPCKSHSPGGLSRPPVTINLLSPRPLGATNSWQQQRIHAALPLHTLPHTLSKQCRFLSHTQITLWASFLPSFPLAQRNRPSLPPRLSLFPGSQALQGGTAAQLDNWCTSPTCLRLRVFEIGHMHTLNCLHTRWTHSKTLTRAHSYTCSRARQSQGGCTTHATAI